METVLARDNLVTTCLNLTHELLKFPIKHVWIDYDEEADVLYLSFRKPQKATATIENDDILIRKDGEDIVGITILHASTR